MLPNFESIPILQIHIRSARTEAHGRTEEIAAESAPPSDALRSSVLFHTPPVRTAISLSIPKQTRKPFLRAVTPQRDACRSPCRNETPDATSNHAEIAERRLTGHAAICGRLAAERYGLEILEEGIETNKRNFTRFLLLADRYHADRHTGSARADKASLVFSLPHTQGSLSKVLTILSFYDINLTKIQSMPIIGCEWEYRFYVDVSFADYTRYRQSIDAITPLTKDFKILGEYAAFNE